MNALRLNKLELVCGQGGAKNLYSIFGVISAYGHPTTRTLAPERKMFAAIAIVSESNQR